MYTRVGDVLILDRAPESFHEHVVQRTSTAIHTDADAGLFQACCEVQRRELRALVRVKDVRLSLRQRQVKRIQAEASIQGVGELPGHYVTTIPIYDCHEVHKPTQHTDVGDVGTPYLIWPRDRQVAQQVWIDLVPFSRDARSRLGIDRL